MIKLKLCSAELVGTQLESVESVERAWGVEGPAGYFNGWHENEPANGARLRV
jgi:hypothetical protein